MVRPSVLLVDPDRARRSLYLCWLRQSRSDLVLAEASTAIAALEQCQQRPPAAVVLAANLPDMDGLRLLSQLSALGSAVIVVVDQGSEAMAVAALRGGARDYLHQGSLTAARLTASLQRVLPQPPATDLPLTPLEVDPGPSVVLPSVLQGTVTGVQDVLQVDRALVVRLTEGTQGVVVAAAHRGQGLAVPVDPLWDVGPFCGSNQPWANVRQGWLTAIDDTAQANLPPAHRHHLDQLAVKASLTAPILLSAGTAQALGRPALWGMLLVYQCDRPRIWHKEEFCLVQDLAEELGLSIQQAELNAHLQTLNHTLSAQVAQHSSQLLTRERQLQMVVANAPVILYAIDRDGIFTLSEGRGLVHLGLKPGQVVGQSVFEAYRDVPEVLGYVRAGLAGEITTWLSEIAGRIYDNHVAPLRDPEGQIQGIIGVATDITERYRAEQRLKDLNESLERRISDRTRALQEANANLVREIYQRQQAETALRQTERDMQAIIAAIPDLLFRLDRNGNYLAAYHSDSILLYKPIECYQGTSLYQVLPFSVAVAMLRGIRRALTTGQTVVLPQTLTIEGKEVYEEVRITPCDEDTALVMIRDISAQHRAEQEAQQSQQRFQRIVRNVPGVLYQFWQGRRGERQFSYINDRIAELVGVSAAAVMADSERLLERVHPEDRPGIEASIQVSARSLSQWQWMGRFLDHQQRVVWVRGLSHPERLGDGSILWSGLLVDITEQRRIQLELARQNLLLEAQRNATLDGILVIDNDLQVSWYNRRFCEIWGINPEDYANDMALVDGLLEQVEQPDAYLAEVEYLYQHPEATSFQEYRLLDGRTLERYCSPIVDANGHYWGRIWYFRDITRRRQAEASSLGHQELREAIFNYSTDAIFLVDPHTLLVLDCNQGAVDLFEAEAKSRLVGTAGTLLQKRPFNETELSDLVETMDREGIWTAELEYVTLRGREFWGNVAAKPIQVAGHDLHMVRVTDVTERKQGEIEIRRALAKERDLSDLRARFIAMTSHEFRTPLAVIASSAGILRSFWDRLATAKRQEHLQIIQTYVQHTVDLLDDILLINRAAVGQLRCVPETVDVVAFCRSLVQDFQLGTQHHQLGFESDLDTLTSPVDPKLLRQIIINLLSNAIKYSPDGGDITLALAATPTALTITITDQGIGIPEADQRQLFEAFHRASNVGDIQGTGLGLSVVKNCVELHGGQVSCHSEVQRGTSFRITLPRQSRSPNPSAQ